MRYLNKSKTVHFVRIVTFKIILELLNSVVFFNHFLSTEALLTKKLQKILNNQLVPDIGIRINTNIFK